MSKTNFEKQQKTFNNFVSNFVAKGFRELTPEELFTVNGGKKKSSSSSSSSSGNSGTKNNTSTASSAAVTAATAGARTGKNIGSTNSNNKSNSGKPNNSTSSNSSSSSNNSISSSDKNSSNGQNSYTVQSGDTLSQITANYNKEHGTNYTYQQVAEKNGISNPDIIHPGQQISFGDNSTLELQPAQQYSSSQNNSSDSHGSSCNENSIYNDNKEEGQNINKSQNSDNNMSEQKDSSKNIETPVNRIKTSILNILHKGKKGILWDFAVDKSINENSRAIFTSGKYDTRLLNGQTNFSLDAGIAETKIINRKINLYNDVVHAGFECTMGSFTSHANSGIKDCTIGYDSDFSIVSYDFSGSLSVKEYGIKGSVSIYIGGFAVGKWDGLGKSISGEILPGVGLGFKTGVYKE